MKIKTSNLKKIALLLIVLVGINIHARADESQVIRDALGAMFIVMGLVLLIFTTVMALLMHFLFNAIAKIKRKSFWKILIGAVLMCSMYVYIEVNSSFLV